MKTTRPELGFERLLAALERDLLDASDKEILAVATELGQKPNTKASAALSGVLFIPRLRHGPKTVTAGPKKVHDRRGANRPRRRTKDDVPPST